MAAMKCTVMMIRRRSNMRAVAVVVGFVLVALVLQGQVGESQAGQQSCSAELNNLNVCAPFVVPGSTNTSPSSDCCTALQSVEHDCLCNTLRVIARLPSQCNLPTLTCGN